MKIQRRSDSVNALRANDQVPGVIYGHGVDSTPIQVDYQVLRKALNQYGTAMTFETELEGETHIVYIKDYQEDFLANYKVIHFDLMKVSATDTISASVPLNFLNRDGIAGAGQVVSTNLNEIEVEYQVGKGTNSIDVDLAPLKLVDAIYVKDVTVPEGITVLNDPEQIVANLTSVSEVVEEVEEVEEDDGEDVVFTTEDTDDVAEPEEE